MGTEGVVGNAAGGSVSCDTRKANALAESWLLLEMKALVCGVFFSLLSSWTYDLPQMDS